MKNRILSIFPFNFVALNIFYIHMRITFCNFWGDGGWGSYF